MVTIEIRESGSKRRLERYGRQRVFPTELAEVSRFPWIYNEIVRELGRIH